MKIIEKFEKKINGVLSGFDRMIIRGHIRQFFSASGKAYFLSAENVKLVDFGEYAQKVTGIIQAHGKTIAVETGRPFVYLNNSKTSKEEVALKIQKEQPVDEGLICIISCVELCHSIQVQKNQATQKLELSNGWRKCLHYYFYYLDREFGFMHVKLQTWFPFEIQVYINGREYIAKQLDKAEIKYTRYDNSFLWIEDVQKAQQIADSIAARDLSSRLEHFAKTVNPFLEKIQTILHHGYYWCLDQCEYATDIMFNHRKELSKIYKDLVGHALTSFNCEDVMVFLGRKMHAAFSGEIVSDFKKRPKGIRIKHRMQSNSIKMYDKYSVLRVETTINDPREFKIFREVGKENKTKKWVPMGKSITNLYRYAQVCAAANKRYLDAVALAEFRQDSISQIEKLSEKVQLKNRTFTGLNPISVDTEKIFLAVLNGGNHINGFTNASIRKILFPNNAKNDLKIRNKITRILSKLRAHKLISKIPHSFRYRVSPKGIKIMTTILEMKKIQFPIALKAS